MKRDPAIDSLLDLHDSILDQGVPYEFKDAQQLINDFLADVDRILQEVRKR